MTALRPIKGKTTCLHCGAPADVFPLGSNPHPGFGSWDVTRDGEYVGGDIHDSSTPLQQFEGMAAKDPDHDWRLSVQGPLWEGVYQRHGEGQWVLVEQGDGFA
jgi:hypothetical protein